MEAATDALSDSTAEVMGIETRASQLSRTRRARPSPSEPTTTTTGPSSPGMPDSGVSPSSGLDVHVILDNYVTHKHATVTRWLACHPGVNSTSPRPLVWAATAESILTKVARGRVTLNRETKSGTHH